MDADQQQVYSDDGKPLQAIYDDDGKPIQPHPEIQSAQPSNAQKNDPTFLSRTEDFGKGLLKFANDTLLGGSLSSPGGLASAASSMVEQPIRTAISGHPLKAVAGLLGFNPDAIYNDIQSSRYGAAAGDILPPALLLGGGALLHGMMGETPALIPDEVAPIIPEVLPADHPVPSRAPLQLGPSQVRGALPAIGETNPAPRFFAGPAGIADAQLAYPYDIQDPSYLKYPNSTRISSDEPGVQSPNDIGPIAAANRTSIDVRDPAQLNPAFRALVPERYSGITTKPLGLQGVPKEGTPEVTQAYQTGGKVIDRPEGEYDPNKVDVVNRQLSQHEPESIAKVIDSNPQTAGQRPIPDIVNSQNVEPVIPSDITTPRAGQAVPTADVGKWSANILSADKILDRYESTAPIADLIRNAQDSKLPFINNTLTRMQQYLGDNSVDNQTIFNILDGKIDPSSVNPVLASKAMGLRGILDDVHAGLPGKVGYISDYITHMRDAGPAQQTLWGYYFGKKPFSDPLQPGSPTAIGNVATPFIERRTGELQDYSTDLPKVLRAYVSSIAKTKFDDPAVMQAKDLLTSIPDNLPKVKAVADAYVRNYTHYNAEGQLAKEFEDWSSAVANTYTRSYLDWNIPLHMLHLGEIPSSVFPELGAKYSAIGAKAFASNPAAITREISANGLLQNSVIPPSFRTTAEKWQSAANFWNVAESVTKGIAYAGAKARALDQGMNPQQAVMKAIADTKDMTYTVDPSRQAKGLTSQSNIAGGQIASKIGQQFKGVPYKIIEQYSNIIKNVGQDLTKAARLLFGAGLAGTGTAIGMHTLHMNPSNLLKPTVLGPFGDVMATVGNDLIKGNLAQAIIDTAAWVTPGGQQVKKLLK